MAHAALDAFHPAVSEWFSERFDAPTPAQVRGWSAIRAGRPTLIAAPTGSGKTLAAFLTAIDGLVREACAAGEDGLPDETRVVYVSPLKALSNDIERNLHAPLQGIQRALARRGLPEAAVRAAVRTGDTPGAVRQSMLRRPPHLLVTTPESLYILLTSARGREMLATTRTIIVDEIHALVGNKRGAHLALTVERLAAQARARVGAPPLRIGLSATQRPIEEVAAYLVGAPDAVEPGPAQEDISNISSAPEIIDEGHRRAADLALELPRSPLTAVMSNEVWQEVYDRLAALIEGHRTTLIFVNTRRMAERVTRHLAERVGADRVGAHHGSMAKEKRLRCEQRLKAGELAALVSTASLELG
ncbi:MAG: DEAD/DEAH box helicase, partial [Myxococcales bacterium]|nr:DEAD/DEAH box helicase [Myxococcales bacterium]